MGEFEIVLELHMLHECLGFSYTPDTLGVTTSKDELRPLNSWQSLQVLEEVADGLPMVTGDL